MGRSFNTLVFVVETGEGRVFTICNRRWQSAYLAYLDRPGLSLSLSTWTGSLGRVELGLKHGLAVLVVISWLKNPRFTTRN